MSDDTTVAGASFRVSAGTEWVQVDDKTAILRSARGKVTLEGPNVGAFLTQVLPLIDGTTALGQIAAASTAIPMDEFQAYLAQLVEAELIVPSGADQATQYARPMVEVLAPYGRQPEAVSHRLRDQRIAIIGLESVGAALALEFARWGVRKLFLVDPGVPRPDDPSQLATTGSEPRHTVLMRQISAAFPDLAVSTPLPDWTAEQLQSIAPDVDILVATVDRDFAAVAHWVNKAACAANKIAAFATVDGDTSTIGPIVYPHETACYMCYRMRAIACEDDYAAAMAFEELRNRNRRQSPLREPTFQPAVGLAAAILAGEIAKTVTAVGRHALAGRVIEWNGVQASFTEHDVLRQPACPVCSKKKASEPGISGTG